MAHPVSIRHLAGILLGILLSGIPVLASAHDLPLGDGHVSRQPQRGYVYACRSQFRGGGARHAGDWVHGDTWNPDQKPHVAGHVLWPDATLSIQNKGEVRLVQGNSLPTEEATGIFPISPQDPAYRFDTNPNRIAAQDLHFDIPATPELASRGSCLPMGMIGFTVTGVAFYSALDDAGRDAAAHEVQDHCDGHPQANSQYHYHNASPCLPNVDSNRVVGWALDGFPILGLRDADGNAVTNATLDACHGRRETVKINERTYHYAYHLTREYPYTLGCFAGRLLPTTRRAIRSGLQPSRRRPPRR